MLGVLGVLRRIAAARPTPVLTRRTVGGRALVLFCNLLLMWYRYSQRSPAHSLPAPSTAAEALSGVANEASVRFPLQMMYFSELAGREVKGLTSTTSWARRGKGIEQAV